MKKITSIMLLLVSAFAFCTAEENAAQPSWGFSLAADFAYHPKADYVKGGNHYAPLTGAYSGVELRVTAHAVQTTPIPFGSHPLVKDNTIAFDFGLELTPVTLASMFTLKFTPVAFLVFSAGAKVGTGWYFPGLDVQGMARLVDPTQKSAGKAYKALVPFGNFYFDTFVGSTFQFDTAAFWPGDWHHIVALATFEAHYSTVSGMRDGEIWNWQSAPNRVNGWNYYSQFVLGYRMPIPLSMVGVNFELSGLFKKDAYNPKKYGNYKSDYMTVDISPVFLFSFAENKHNLFLVFNFERRRSFAEEHSHEHIEPKLTHSGYEWFFRRIALSYTVRF